MRRWGGVTEQALPDGNCCRKAAGEVFYGVGAQRPQHDRIIKVARTIADLDGSDIITAAHLAEAVQLRTSLNS